jgi:hypothetical protein
MEEQGKVTALSQLTRLRPEFAHQLLASNLWNYEMAVKGFEIMRSKGEVPAHTFMM